MNRQPVAGTRTLMRFLRMMVGLPFRKGSIDSTGFESPRTRRLQYQSANRHCAIKSQVVIRRLRLAERKPEVCLGRCWKLSLDQLHSALRQPAAIMHSAARFFSTSNAHTFSHQTTERSIARYFPTMSTVFTYKNNSRTSKVKYAVHPAAPRISQD